MKEITFQMASHAQDYLEVTIERHYTDIKELMTSYQKLILENQIVLEELDMECQEKINEDMAYALSYLSIYNNQLNVPKMHREMNNLMIIYGLSDMIYRGMTLVKFYAPNGVMLSEILHSCFCSHYNKTDVEVQQEKLQIIEELKELVNSDETLNHTFTKFRELQQRWKETGLVPQQNVKDLWETYNLHVENFYSFIKINKELRDLDLKKNYEQKLALCEAAEALVLEPSIVEAFHKLQKLHDEWRETGPVANEFKETLWERFKEASSRINKQHQAFFENIKAEQTKNLELKAGLCEQTEELAQQLYTTRKEWNRASDRLLEIQKVWKTIGFAPKKDNTRIYERFRTACDRFFEAKRRFYADVKTEMEHNLQLKNELCEAAEALQMSEEWKKTTDELIALQARWKEIGAVSRRYSDQVWKRFRAACDKFFERKAAHFSDVDGQYEQNLVRKQALLDEMAAADVKEGGFEMIKEFQRRWSEIGFVPIKRKDEIQKRYKECVDTLFSVLRGSERDRSMSRFREKVSAFKASGDRRIRTERDRLYNRVKQLESDIALLENNIGFFAHSKGAEALIADVREKIERAKREMADTIEKVKLIDREVARESEDREA